MEVVDKLVRDAAVRYAALGNAAEDDDDGEER